MTSPRTTSQASFWNDRYGWDAPEPERYAFGSAPDPFIADTLLDLEQTGALLHPANVVDLGGGEGRHGVFAAQRGHQVRVVDFAETGLVVAARLAAEAGVPLDTEAADLTTWQPDRAYDLVLLGFVHLLPAERQRLLARLQTILRPGGWLVARWFTPAHAEHGTFGPSARDRLVSADLLRAELEGGQWHRCNERTVVLDSGRYLRGAADVLDVVWQAPA
ncbi:MAG: class I SAM-dependent methyltransferase [Bacteroidota bacterium]